MAVLKQFLTSLIGIVIQPSVPKLLTIFLSNTFLIHRSATLNISRSGDHPPPSTMLLCGLLEFPSPLLPQRSLCFSLVPLIRFADRAAACDAVLKSKSKPIPHGISVPMAKSGKNYIFKKSRGFDASEAKPPKTPPTDQKPQDTKKNRQGPNSRR